MKRRKKYKVKRRKDTEKIRRKDKEKRRTRIEREVLCGWILPH